MAQVFKAKAKPSAYEMRREHGHDFPGGVRETAEKLASKQNEGWLGSRSIHTRQGQIRRRLKRLKRLEKAAKKAA